MTWGTLASGDIEFLIGIAQPCHCPSQIHPGRKGHNPKQSRDCAARDLIDHLLAQRNELRGLIEDFNHRVDGITALCAERLRQARDETERLKSALWEVRETDCASHSLHTLENSDDSKS